MGFPTSPPFPIYTNATGEPLEGGYVYFGVANQNPQTNPIAIYWDEDETIPAAQPVRTSGGYIVRNGTPGTIYVADEYSITVRDRQGDLVYSAPVSPSSAIIGPGGAGLVGFSQDESYGQGTVGNRLAQTVSVRDAPFNAMGDLDTDDTAAILAAYSFAKAAGRSLYFPGCEPGKGYKMTTTLVIDQDAFTVYGDGPSSMIVAYNAIGLPAIRVEADHAMVRDLGITGIDGSGHGLQCGVSGGATAYYGTYENLWISWLGGNCIDCQFALSSVFTNINMDAEIITSPVTLPGGVSKGQRLNGVNIRLASPANNNDLTFSGVIVNAASDSANPNAWEVNIGSDGSGGFTTLDWNGGLIQSYANLIKITGGAQHIHFAQMYAEPSVSPGTITIDTASSVTFDNVFLDANTTVTNAPSCAFRNLTTNSITLEGTSNNCVIENLIYSSLGGSITDNTPGGTAIIRSAVSSSNTRFADGLRFASPPTRWYATECEEWLGGGSPSTPGGIYNQGATISREASIKPWGTYSMKITCAASSFDTGARIDLPNSAVASGNDIVLDLWMYVTAGDIGGVTFVTNAATVTRSIEKTGQWIRRVLRFNGVVGTDTSGYLLITGDPNAVVYAKTIIIDIANYAIPQTKTLADSATPDVTTAGNGGGGPMIGHGTTSATTAITGFSGMVVGQLLTVTLGAATDFTNSATLKLAGNANWTTGLAGDVAGFRYDIDGVTREQFRSINN